jgi:hypothetical protein
MRRVSIQPCDSKWMPPASPRKSQGEPESGNRQLWTPGRHATPSRSSNRSASHSTNRAKDSGRSAKRRRSWGEFTRVCTQAQETCPMLSLWWRRRGHECRACAHLRRATSAGTSHTTRRALAAQPTLCSNKSQSDAKDDSVALTTRPTAAELAGMSITRGRRRKATHPRGAGDTDPGRLT